MKKIFWNILSAAGLLLMATYAQSQTIVIDRVDVDSSRAGIVTAGYGFELKIAMQDIENVNNVSFKLVFDNAQYISFSEYAYGDFDNPDFIFVNPPQPGGNSLSVSAFSGESLPNSDLDNPEVITLRFTVAKNSPNGTDVNFTFENAFATSYSEQLGGQSIELSGMDFGFVIHGFIDVWPGDANADGTVDAADQNTIGLYLGEGSLSPNMRAFRRQSPSTRFYPQKVLLWDVPQITHADCDGDGDVTVEDGMVVFLNEGKVVGQADGLIGTEDDDSGNTDSEFESMIINSNGISNTVKPNEFKNSEYSYPVSIISEYEWESTVIRLKINNDANLIGISNGNLLGDGYKYLAHQSGKNIEILMGEFGDKMIYSNSGLLAELKFDKETSVIPQTAKAMDSAGFKFDIDFATTSVEDEEQNTAKKAKVTLEDYISENPDAIFDVYDTSGRMLYQALTSDKINDIIAVNKMLFICSESEVWQIR